jgi:flagellar assembly protein FliH
MASLSSQAAGGAIRKMVYPPVGQASASGGEQRWTDPEARIRELEAQLQEQEQRFAEERERIRSAAAEEERKAAAGAQAEWRRSCEATLGAALDEFRGTREEYLGRVEHEVVRLALAIAERILYREAQADPLLLAGVVRVALGRIADSTAVRLRVPESEQALWAEMLRLMPGLPLRPEVRGDATLQPTEALLEADIGSVDLGVRSQIREIERSFFDPAESETSTAKEMSGSAAPGVDAGAGGK